MAKKRRAKVIAGRTGGPWDTIFEGDAAKAKEQLAEVKLDNQARQKLKDEIDSLSMRLFVLREELRKEHYVIPCE